MTEPTTFLFAADDPESVHFAVGSNDGAVLTRKENGTAELTGLHIFRAGEFRDSLGRDRQYTAEDLNELAANYDGLVQSGAFPNVPVRTDHSRSIQSVVGYFTKIYAKGKDLFANILLTEPDAVDKWERRTYRSRSLEVGRYRTNGGDFVSPTVLGLAFVDVPAVEGLFQYHDDHGDNNVQFTQEQLDWAVASAYAQGIEDTKPSDEDIQYAIACGYAQADDDLRAEFEKNSDRPPYQFRIGEELTYEYAAVQSTLDTLYAFRKETVESNRTAFIDQLVKDDKIAATQAEGLKTFAKGLSDQQFADFRANYDGAPKLGMLGDHTSTDNPAGGGTSQFQRELDDARSVVDMHRRSGMSEEQVKQTASFVRMTELENQIQEN